MYNDAGERTYTVTAKGEITSYAYDEASRLTEVSYPLSNDKTMEDLKERISFGLGAKDGHNPHGLDTAMKGLAFAQSDAFDPGELKDSVSKLESGNNGLEVGIGAGAKKFGERLSVDSPTADALTQAYGLVNDSRGKRLNLTQWMWTEEYGYDSQGNRTSLANGWGEIPYAYDAANRMLEAGKRDYGWDANGNLISESLGQKDASYSYTPENRIGVAVTEFDDSDQDKGNPPFPGKDGKGVREVGYAYDALGRRISRTAGYAPDDAKKSPRDIISERCLPGTGQGSGSTMDQTQEYLYDGTSFMVIAEMTKTGGGRGDARFNWQSESSTVGYVYANGALVEKRDATGWSRNESVLYYTQDILGSTMQVTDERGKVKESYAYDAFGVAYRGSLSDVNSVGYNGKKYDAELGLYNYGYRDYEPRVGRWMTSDLIKSGLNWYVYVKNNPVNYIDMLGFISSDAAASTLASANDKATKIANAIASGDFQGACELCTTDYVMVPGDPSQYWEEKAQEARDSYKQSDTVESWNGWESGSGNYKCNVFVDNTLHENFSEVYPELGISLESAEAMGTDIANSSRFERITGSTSEDVLKNAQSLADQGYLVILTYDNPDPTKSGHIGFVGTSDLVLNSSAPNTFNGSTQNPNESPYAVAVQSGSFPGAASMTYATNDLTNQISGTGHEPLTSENAELKFYRVKK